MRNAATIGSKSKLEETSLLCTVSLFSFCLCRTQVYKRFFCASNSIHFRPDIPLWLHQHRKYMLYMILNHFSNYTSQSKAVLSALLSAAYANAFLTSVDTHNGYLKVQLKSIRRISRAWSTHFDPALASTIERWGQRYKKGAEIPLCLFQVQMRACPHCTEKSGRQLDRFCSSGRGSVRAATAETVAPSHPCQRKPPAMPEEVSSVKKLQLQASSEASC